MRKRMKAYLPRWILWLIWPILIVVWAVVTYTTFRTPSGREEFGLFGWLAVTLLLVLVGGGISLMASGRLPAYIIEIEDDDEVE